MPGLPATAPPASYRPVTGCPASWAAVTSSRPPARPMRGALGHSRNTSRSASASGTNRTETSPVTSRFPGSTLRWAVYRGRSGHGSGYPAGTSQLVSGAGAATGAVPSPAGPGETRVTVVVDGGGIVVDGWAAAAVVGEADEVVEAGAASRSSPAQPAPTRRATAPTTIFRTRGSVGAPGSAADQTSGSTPIRRSISAASR